MKLGVIYIADNEAWWPDHSAFDYKYFNKAPLSMGFDGVEFWYRKSLPSTARAIEFVTSTGDEYFPVVVVDTLDSYLDGYFGYCYKAWWPWTRDPIIELAGEKIKKWSGPFMNLFAKWVLKHEFGHARDLKHCTNLFCIMRKPNLSFGRFCRKCTKQLQENK